MDADLLKKPSAFFPMVMSVAALSIVLGSAAMFGVARQADEGTAAHLWQILIAGQIPLIVFFAVRWIPAQHKKGLFVLALQLSAVLAAMFPVWWLGW